MLLWSLCDNKDGCGSTHLRPSAPLPLAAPLSRLFFLMQGEAAVLKNAVPCLGQLLAAFNHADWPSAAGPFSLLLR